VLDGVPLDALAIRLGSTRNAIYKTMFDARLKLRAALAANGYLDDQAVWACSLTRARAMPASTARPQST
jgi:hypothetical protein